MIYLAASILGFVAGLRTFTAPAVFLLFRGGIAGYVLALAAAIEMFGDTMPKALARTVPMALIPRILSGAFVGWMVFLHNGPPVIGVLIGAIAAFAGAHLGLAARIWAIARVGALPAALLEDAVAIALAIVAVTRV